MRSNKAFVFILALVGSACVYGQDTPRVTQLYNLAEKAYLGAQYEKASEYLNERLAIYQEKRDVDGQVRTLLWLGEIHRASRAFHRSLDYYDMAERLLDGNTKTEDYAHLLNRRAATFYEMNRVDEALSLSQKSLSLCATVRGAAQWKGSNLSIIGASFLALDKLDSAIHYMRHGLAVAIKNKNVDEQITAAINIGNHYRDQDRIDSMKYYALLAVKLSTKHRLRSRIYHAYRLLSDAYKIEGNYKSALEYQYAHMLLRDSLLQEETQARFQKASNDYEKSYLKKDKELLEAQVGGQRITMLLLLIIGLLAGIFLFVFIRKNRSTRLLNKKLQEKQAILDKNNDDLSEAVELKNRLFSVLAHDLQGPLNSLAGVLELIQGPDIDQATKEGLLLKLKTQLKANQGLLISIITWSKMQLNGVNGAMDPTDIAQIIQNELEFVALGAQAKEIDLLREVKCTRPIPTNGHVVGLIVRNLLSNAMKFTPRGGQVSVLAECAEREFVVKVKDNGIGMDKAQANALFDQLNDSREGTEKERGFGLGLMLCRDFANKMGAKIEVESAPGLGTCISVLFPL
ncbi:MAG: HAMP domain-containing histidine kinase [Bacteroidetes bacterium]|nr:HAMP domain-containing histidine kinase [Bacteroidota bacterium]